MIRDIQFDYLGNNERVMIRISQLALYDTWGFIILSYPLTELESAYVQIDSKMNLWRRYELILDLNGCLDADL